MTLPAKGPGGNPGGPTHVYCDESGQPILRATGPPGQVSYERRVKARWVPGLQGARLLPYRLDLLARSAVADPVFIADAEDAVDALTGHNLVATCSPVDAAFGVGDWCEFLTGRRVAILGKSDTFGRNTSEGLAKAIGPVAAEVRVIELPGLKAHQPLAAWLESWRGATGPGQDLGAVLTTLFEDTPPFGTADEPEPPTGLQVFAPGEGDHDEDDGGAVIDRWPKIDPRAFHGIAGEIVAMIDPETEADPVATLTQFLVAFANLIGRSAHYRVGATFHYLNLFCVLVGATALGRKGTSWDIARWALALCDHDWDRGRIQSGLVSGEGLIHHVRDEVFKDGRVIDEGVRDKRLLIVETEMSRTLKAMARESNTLSDVIRQAWDSGHLRTLGKHQPARATSAHIGIICHTTQADVRKHLTETDSANGFSNRFLWVAVRRSKMLPEGGNFTSINWTEILRRMTAVVVHARGCGEMTRDKIAGNMWRDVYPHLSEGKPGLLGTVTTRAEAQTMRLACVYALLDGSPVVGPEHLAAALALWEYCEASARLVFGDSHGDQSADKLLAALRAAPGGLSRKQIFSDVFQKNKKSAEIARLLSDLLTHGLIHRKQVKTGGRPAEMWFKGSGLSTYPA